MKFEYRNDVLSRGTWFKGFDLKLVLKRTQTNICETQIPLKWAKNARLSRNPDSPSIGLDSPDLCARSVRVSNPERKSPKDRSLRAYTRSLRVTLGQRLVSGPRSINTPHTPSAIFLLPIWRAEHLPKIRKSSLTPLSPFLSDSFEGFEWEASKSKNSC